MKKIDPELKKKNKLEYDRKYRREHLEERNKKAREYMRRRKIKLLEEKYEI